MNSLGDVVPGTNPKYPNPTIVEALCELHFEQSGGSEVFDISKPLDFYSAVGASFPHLKTASDKIVEVVSGSAGQTGFREIFNQRLQFFSEDQKSLIQLGEGGSILTYNVLKPYPGWETMLGVLEKHWTPMCDVIKPKAIKQIGLRYINRVDFFDAETKLSYWLKPNKYLPEALIASAEPFEYRSSLRIEDHRDVVININSSKRPEIGFVFDIDVIWRNSIGIDLTDLKKVLTTLHDDEWEVFNSSITEKYNLLLQNKHLKTA